MVQQLKSLLPACCLQEYPGLDTPAWHSAHESICLFKLEVDQQMLAFFLRKNTLGILEATKVVLTTGSIRSQ